MGDARRSSAGPSGPQRRIDLYIVAWTDTARRWEVYRNGAEPRFPERFMNREDALARAVQLARGANEDCIELRDSEGRAHVLDVEYGAYGD